MGGHSDTEPRVRCHAPLSGIGGLLQCASISSCKSSCPLSEVKKCLLFEGSVYISYIGGLAGAKARCPLDRGVCYLECPLKEVPLYTVEPPKMDSPYYGNLHNADKCPWSQIITYSLLYIATSV